MTLSYCFLVFSRDMYLKKDDPQILGSTSEQSSQADTEGKTKNKSCSDPQNLNLLDVRNEHRMLRKCSAQTVKQSTLF